ncbi:MAG: 2-C-methyl-D-erythritol 4-phosphate cytidylyltransferase [Ruminococcus sp.]|nr:2-C-methyl-D-erythritol 4-phosphate cytidylyltransferase [Ruminococcus sp.]
MKKHPFTSAVIVAAGNATRMGLDTPKQLLMINGKTVIEHTLSAFESCALIDEIIVVTREQDIEEIKHVCQSFEKLKAIVPGGKERSDSVKNGISAADSKAEFYAIHDGARMLITEEEILSVLQTAYTEKAATLGTPVTDTVKMVDGMTILSTPDRSALYAVQTPQVFEKELYLRALKNAEDKRLKVTDDCSMAEALGEKVTIALGEYTNIKLTTKTDLLFAQAILKDREKDTI